MKYKPAAGCDLDNKAAPVAIAAARAAGGPALVPVPLLPVIWSAGPGPYVITPESCRACVSGIPIGIPNGIICAGCGDRDGKRVIFCAGCGNNAHALKFAITYNSSGAIWSRMAVNVTKYYPIVTKILQFMHIVYPGIGFL